jgi:hypothetical protein
MDTMDQENERIIINPQNNKRPRLLFQLLKAVVGFIAIFIVHLPRLLFYLLMVSYAWVFNHYDNLTADPKEHLIRAKRLLKKKRDNSVLLYSAVEIRFALERMVDSQLIFATKVSNRMLEEYDPIKKRKWMSLLDSRADFPHKIWWLAPNGEKIEAGHYRPLDTVKVGEIKGRLGDLLHPKRGLSLGIATSPYYVETRKFLWEAHDYLWTMNAENRPFFIHADNPKFELKQVELEELAPKS